MMSDRGGNQQNRNAQGGQTGGNQQPRPQQQPPGQPTGQARGGQGVGDIATSPTTKSYLKFFTGIYAVVGLAVGLSVVLIGVAGGSPLEPDLSGTVQNALDQNVNNVDAILQQMQMNRLGATAINAAPLLAAVLGVITGGYVGSRLGGSDREAYITAGLSAGVGSVVLVAITGFLASTQINPVPQPELAEGATGTTGAQADLGMGAVEGIPSAILIGGTDLAAGDLLINSVLVGVAVAVFAAATVYVVRNFSPEA
ncbi:hypothetical protein [Halostella litorea]|uniref:hypothetical protein n=1 Tax=Halostella litorea TaxID=2528831 RepID=UPI0010925A8E|nr:hypothetical protein [Halostella litorea]